MTRGCFWSARRLGIASLQEALSPLKPRGSKYSIFKDPGSKSHALAPTGDFRTLQCFSHASAQLVFGTRVLKYWLLGPWLQAPVRPALPCFRHWRGPLSRASTSCRHRLPKYSKDQMQHTIWGCVPYRIPTPWAGQSVLNSKHLCPPSQNKIQPDPAASATTMGASRT